MSFIRRKYVLKNKAKAKKFINKDCRNRDCQGWTEAGRSLELPSLLLGEQSQSLRLSGRTPYKQIPA